MRVRSRLLVASLLGFAIAIDAQTPSPYQLSLPSVLPSGASGPDPPPAWPVATFP